MNSLTYTPHSPILWVVLYFIMSWPEYLSTPSYCWEVSSRPSRGTANNSRVADITKALLVCIGKEQWQGSASQQCGNVRLSARTMARSHLSESSLGCKASFETDRAIIGIGQYRMLVMTWTVLGATSTKATLRFYSKCRCGVFSDHLVPSGVQPLAYSRCARRGS